MSVNALQEAYCSEDAAALLVLICNFASTAMKAGKSVLRQRHNRVLPVQQGVQSRVRHVHRSLQKTHALGVMNMKL